LEDLSRHDIIKSAGAIIALLTFEITQFISGGTGEDLESERERRNRDIAELDAYKDMGFQQQKLEEEARKLAEVLHLDNALSTQH
jgi:hypothetical protein